MKKHIFLSIIATVSFASLSAQLRSNGEVENNIQDENAFLDASYAYGDYDEIKESKGKGLIFPTVDLTVFEFKLDGYVAGDFDFKHYFDGMVVYNTATEGQSATGIPTDLSPGFYFFYNPDGRSNASVTEGQWIPMGKGMAEMMQVKGIHGIVAQKIAADTTEVSLSIEGAQNGDVLVYNADYEDPSGEWTGRWEPKSPLADEQIWLPAINLPWNLDGSESGEIDLFKIYQQSFVPESGQGGMPGTAGGVEPTTYGGTTGNYVSSTGAFRPLGRAADTRQSFDYIVTYFDNSMVTITELSAEGMLRYKPVAGVIPPVNAFISVLLVRK